MIWHYRHRRCRAQWHHGTEVSSISESWRDDDCRPSLCHFRTLKACEVTDDDCSLLWVDADCHALLSYVGAISIIPLGRYISSPQGESRTETTRTIPASIRFFTEISFVGTFVGTKIKTARRPLISLFSGGKGGIRTLDTGEPYTGFRVQRIRPLCHLSVPVDLRLGNRKAQDHNRVSFDTE